MVLIAVGLRMSASKKASVGRTRLAHRADGGLCLLARREAVNREAGARRGKCRPFLACLPTSLLSTT